MTSALITQTPTRITSGSGSDESLVLVNYSDSITIWLDDTASVAVGASFPLGPLSSTVWEAGIPLFAVVDVGADPFLYYRPGTQPVIPGQVGANITGDLTLAPGQSVGVDGTAQVAGQVSTIPDPNVPSRFNGRFLQSNYWGDYSYWLVGSNGILSNSNYTSEYTGNVPAYQAAANTSAGYMTFPIYYQQRNFRYITFNALIGLAGSAPIAAGAQQVVDFCFAPPSGLGGLTPAGPGFSLYQYWQSISSFVWGVRSDQGVVREQLFTGITGSYVYYNACFEVEMVIDLQALTYTFTVTGRHTAFNVLTAASIFTSGGTVFTLNGTTSAASLASANLAVGYTATASAYSTVSPNIISEFDLTWS